MSSNNLGWLNLCTVLQISFPVWNWNLCWSLLLLFLPEPLVIYRNTGNDTRVNDCLSHRSSIVMDMRATCVSGSINWVIHNASWLHYMKNHWFAYFYTIYVYLNLHIFKLHVKGVVIRACTYICGSCVVCRVRRCIRTYSFFGLAM
jgi:hypothetical protein